MLGSFAKIGWKLDKDTIMNRTFYRNPVISTKFNWGPFCQSGVIGLSGCLIDIGAGRSVGLLAGTLVLLVSLVCWFVQTTGV